MQNENSSKLVTGKEAETVGLLKADKIIKMVERTLDCVDVRLMDHGLRVAFLVNGMLDAEGQGDRELRKNLMILALLHDVGAYRTEEIDKMVEFETEKIWEHSIYGYLVLREFTPLKALTEVILYHHAPVGQLADVPETIRHYAQIFHVADRVDIFWENVRRRDSGRLREVLQKRCGSSFSQETVDLFWQAETQYGLLERLDGKHVMEEVLDSGIISEQEAEAYLELLVFSIDFRSRFTVTHTVNTIQISKQLARRMGLSPQSVEKVCYGALMHDLGKIGTPLTILEKPGRLTGPEMDIMREHVGITGRIIEGCVDEDVARIALRHHEKLDGSGYPSGLTAQELNLEERILAVADIISALCGTRSYKEAFPKEKVLGVLEEMCAKGQLDRNITAQAELEFDSIMANAQAGAEPLLKIYEQLAAENEVLSEQFLAM